MYQPPMPPPPPPARHGLPGYAGALLAMGGLVLGAMGGCVVGVGIASTPDPQARPVATLTVTPTQAETSPASIPASASPTQSAPAKSPTPVPTPVTKVKVPDLEDLDGATAESKLSQLGVTNVQFSSADPSASVVILPANWRVVGQTPDAGSRIEPHALVVLRVKKIA